MDKKYLEKIYNEVSDLNEIHKHTRRKSKVNDLDAEVYRAFIKSNPGSNIRNSTELNNLYCIYRDYISETNSKVKNRMDKILDVYDNDKSVRDIFNKLKFVSDRELEVI